MYLTDKIAINPPKVATEKLWQVSYICKDIWNIFNDERTNARVSMYDQKKRLPVLKKADPKYKIPSSQVLSEVVLSLDRAWKGFLEKRKNGDKESRPPKFKSYKYFFTQKYPQRYNSFEIIGNLLRLAYGRNRKDWIEIPLPELSYNYDTIKNVVISYDKVQKRWYAIFVREVETPAQIKEGHAIYFDPGCKTTLTGIKTDYTVWEYDINPLRKLNMKHYKLIDKLKAERDIKKKYSRQWRRINAKIKSIHRKINTQSKHYSHKLANKILDDHPDVYCFAVGDWDKKSTMADTGIKVVDKRINRQVMNNNPVQKLIEYLNYKAQLRGQQVEKFDERGTTRTCSKCDNVRAEPLKPAVRVYKCEVCGFEIERDVNSALNDLKRYQYALWQGLRAVTALSIARVLLNPSSGKNRKVLYRTLILNYQNAR